MNNAVYAVTCRQYDLDLIRPKIKEIFDAFGGVESLLSRGGNVLVKPNLLMSRHPDEATTTHPHVVQAVCELFVEAGALVTIADSPGGPYGEALVNAVYKTSGMAQAARASGAMLNRDFGSKAICYEGERKREFDMINPATQADVIINLAKMKTHGLSYFTGAVKNNFGTVAGLKKAMMHKTYPDMVDFASMLVDLCQCVSPAISIIDGVEGMDGKGPSGGRPRPVGVLIGSTSPYAADLTAMHIAGLNPALSPVHMNAAARGLVPEQYAGLTQIGEEIEPLSEPFIPPMKVKGNTPIFNWLPRKIRYPLKRMVLPLPHFTDQCIGCGDCARICPGRAIEVKDRKAILTRKRCIQCYCCHEVCPVKAIELK